MNFSDSVLIESKTARDQGLSAIATQDLQQRLLNKTKSLFFALWQGDGYITTRQVAEYYEVPENTIRQNYLRCKAEFDADGVKRLDSKAIQDARDILSLPSKTSQVTIYTPRAVIRMGFILQESAVAAQVRTSALNVLQGVGSLVSSNDVLANLVCGNPPYGALINKSDLKISAPLAPHYDLIAKKLKSTYSTGAIPGFGKAQIREKLAALSTYTQTWKLDSQKEIKFQLKSARMKYPDLMSGLISVNVDGVMRSALFIFQIEDFLVDVEHVEECRSRQYAKLAKQRFAVDYVYQFLVAPFGATPDAEEYIKTLLSQEERGFLGVITVKDLAEFLRDQAWSERHRGLVKAEINSQFKDILGYRIPDAPLEVLFGLNFSS